MTGARGEIERVHVAMRRWLCCRKCEVVLIYYRLLVSCSLLSFLREEYVGIGSLYR